MYNKIILITGVARSGTSWIGQIIDSSPEVVYRFQPLFSYAFKGFLDSNFIGIGTGGFPSLLNRQDELYPHNIILEVLVEQGLAGFILISLLFLLTLRRVSLSL